MTDAQMSGESQLESNLSPSPVPLPAADEYGYTLREHGATIAGAMVGAIIGMIICVLLEYDYGFYKDGAVQAIKMGLFYGGVFGGIVSCNPRGILKGAIIGANLGWSIGIIQDYLFYLNVYAIYNGTLSILEGDWLSNVLWLFTCSLSGLMYGVFFGGFVGALRTGKIKVNYGVIILCVIIIASIQAVTYWIGWGTDINKAMDKTGLLQQIDAIFVLIGVTLSIMFLRFVRNAIVHKMQQAR